MFGLKDMFTDSIAIDLGTVNTLVAVKEQGIVLREPSVVALSADRRREPLAIGNEALAMLGRAPGSVTVVHPLKNGVLSDFSMSEVMLKHFIKNALGRRIPGTNIRAVVCVPGCISDIERRAVEDALKAAGAREAFLIDEPVAAAMGSGVPIGGAVGTMVVDVGGGTTDAVVMAFGGVVVNRSMRAGGTHIDEAIIQHVRNEHGVNIGESTAEQIKLVLGAALPGVSGGMTARGRAMDTGLPKEIRVMASEIYYAIRKPVGNILELVMQTLERTPPELAGDLLETGVVLTGGCAKLQGLRELIEQKTKIQTYIAQDSEECVAYGALLAVENIAQYRVEAKRATRTPAV